VIPILFIALLLPGGVMHRYAIWVKRWTIRRLPVDDFHYPEHQPLTWAFVTSTVRMSFTMSGIFQLFSYLVIPVAATLIFGSFSEACAMLALAGQHATHTEHNWVLWAVVSLPFIAAASSALAVMWAPLAEREQLARGSRYAERRAGHNPIRKMEI
jgi:hypothetical protein